MTPRVSLFLICILFNHFYTLSMFHRFEPFESNNRPIEHLFDGETQKTLIPYAYQTLENYCSGTKRTPHTSWVPEYCYTIIKKLGQAIVMAPLDPCIGIFILYKKIQKKKLLAFHFRTFQNSPASFIHIVQKMFGRYDPSKMKALLHSTQMDPNTQYSGIDRDINARIKQKAIILELATLLNTKLGITKNNITINLFQKPVDRLCKKYASTYSSIIVDIHMKPSTIGITPELYYAMGQHRVVFKDHVLFTDIVPNNTLWDHITILKEPHSLRLDLVAQGICKPETIQEALLVDGGYRTTPTTPFMKIKTINCAVCSKCKLDTLFLNSIQENIS